MHLFGDNLFVFLDSDYQMPSFSHKATVIELNYVYKLSIKLNLANNGIEKQVYIRK